MAKRDDSEKLRTELIPPSADIALARVLTFGARKYAPRNWEKGLAWSRVIGPLKRHLAAFEHGEDIDPESGLLHVEHLLCNAAFLVEFYQTHPELDDRPRRQPKLIGLDIDDVIADFLGAYMERFDVQNPPQSWYFDKDIVANMKLLETDQDFWMNLKPKVDPATLKFEPHCYITARPIPVEWTTAWLEKNGFPMRPVYSVGFNMSKKDAIKQSGCQWFVDDRYENYLEINTVEGVCCFLLTTTQNTKFDVGAWRIDSLDQLPIGRRLK